jgi:hypothetical protein
VRLAGAIVRLVVRKVPDRVAVIVDVRMLDCPSVDTLNVADVAPCATVTVAGTVAPVVALRATSEPPCGAGLARVIVPTETLPPMSEFGEVLTLLKRGVWTVRDPVMVVFPWVAGTTADTSLDTALVVAVKVAEGVSIDESFVSFHALLSGFTDFTSFVADTLKTLSLTNSAFNPG